MNAKQSETMEAFTRWRAFIHKTHGRAESQIDVSEDEGIVIVETDGYAWKIDENGELDTIS